MVIDHPCRCLHFRPDVPGEERSQAERPLQRIGIQHHSAVHIGTPRGIVGIGIIQLHLMLRQPWLPPEMGHTQVLEQHAGPFSRVFQRRKIGVEHMGKATSRHQRPHHFTGRKAVSLLGRQAQETGHQEQRRKQPATTRSVLHRQKDSFVHSHRQPQSKFPLRRGPPMPLVPPPAYGEAPVLQYGRP